MPACVGQEIQPIWFVDDLIIFDGECVETGPRLDGGVYVEQ